MMETEGNFFYYSPEAIKSDKVRTSFRGTIPLFPDWNTTEFEDKGVFYISYECYIRWKDHENIWRQELKRCQFTIKNKEIPSFYEGKYDFKDYKNHTEKIYLRIFIKDCYESMFHNCEKYRHRKYIDWPDPYQKSEKRYYIEQYEESQLFEAVQMTDFTIDI
jgi:hypothetical protein